MAAAKDGRTPRVTQDDTEGFCRSLRSFGSLVDLGRRIGPTDTDEVIYRQLLLATMGATGAVSGAVFRRLSNKQLGLVDAFGPWEGAIERGSVPLVPEVIQRLDEGRTVDFPTRRESTHWRTVTDSRLPGFQARARIRLEGGTSGVGLVLLGERIGGAPFGKVETELLGSLAGLFTILIEKVEPATPRTRSRTTRRRPAAPAKIADAGHPALGRYLGRSEAVRRILSDIHGVAATNCPILLEGESGTGKELLARVAHEIACDENAPFEAISCGAIPETLIESELFGHDKGAFTGADRNHKGVFERARGGTVFLDEIGEMPLSAQVKLLRVLQEGNYLRVGGEELQSCESRVIAATNRDLQREAESGRFRQDLFYRLNVFPIRLPPLRERPGDVPLLVEHFLSSEAEELGREVPVIRTVAMRRLALYAYPGNVRELQNICRALLVDARGATAITDRHVISVFSRHRVSIADPGKSAAVPAVPAAPGSNGAMPAETAAVKDVGGWVLGELRRYYFNLALAERMLDKQRRAAADRRSVPVYSRSGLTYYLQGECIRSLLQARFDRAAAALRIAEDDESLPRVRGKLDGFADGALETLKGGGSSANARLLALRSRFSKLPACYQDDLASLAQAFESGRFR